MGGEAEGGEGGGVRLVWPGQVWGWGKTLDVAWFANALALPCVVRPQSASARFPLPIRLSQSSLENLASYRFLRKNGDHTFILLNSEHFGYAERSWLTDFPTLPAPARRKVWKKGKVFSWEGGWKGNPGAPCSPCLATQLRPRVSAVKRPGHAHLDWPWRGTASGHVLLPSHGQESCGHCLSLVPPPSLMHCLKWPRTVEYKPDHSLQNKWLLLKWFPMFLELVGKHSQGQEPFPGA